MPFLEINMINDAIKTVSDFLEYMGYIKYYLPNEELAQNHPNEILGEVCE